jgi:hypothetical protein
VSNIDVTTVTRTGRSLRNYAKALLNAASSFWLALVIPMFVVEFRAMSSDKATGLAAVAGGLVERLTSPWFWALFVVFFSILYFSGHARSKTVRVVFFWLPASAVCIFCFGLWALFLYAGKHAGM